MKNNIKDKNIAVNFLFDFKSIIISLLLKLFNAYKIIKNNNNYTKEYLFDVFTKYELYEESEGFVF